jgi:hypothetical protein
MSVFHEMIRRSLNISPLLSHSLVDPPACPTPFCTLAPIPAKCISTAMDTINNTPARVVFVCVGLLGVLILLQSTFTWYFSVCGPTSSRPACRWPWLSFTMHVCCSFGIITISGLWHQWPESSRLLQGLLVLSLVNEQIGQVCRTTFNKTELT